MASLVSLGTGVTGISIPCKNVVMGEIGEMALFRKPHDRHANTTTAEHADEDRWVRTHSNPWVRLPVDDHPPSPPPPPPQPEDTSRVTPLLGLRVPQLADRLPRRQILADLHVDESTIWWLGVHGGAGESTLQALCEGSRAADHAWPIPAGDASTTQRVVLVARTSIRGLRAAQHAGAEWASGSVAAQLLGLVLIADAPGRLPRALRDLAELIGGGVPTLWMLPWIEQLRTDDALAPEAIPKPMQQLLNDLQATTEGERHELQQH